MSSYLPYVLPISAIVLLFGSALNPFLSLAFAVLFIGVQFGTWPGTDLRFAPSDIFLLFGLLGIFLQRRTRSEVLEKSPTRWWFLALLALYVLGNFITSVSVGKILQRQLINRNIGLLVLFAYYYLAIVLIDSREKMEKIIKLYVYAGFLLNLIAIIGYLSHQSFFVMEGTRLIGFLQDPSAWGCFLLPLLFLQVTLLLNRYPLFSLRFSIINILLLSLGIVLTISRSTYLAFFLTLFFFLFFQRRSLLFLPLLGLSAICLFFIFYFFGPHFQQKFVSDVYWKQTIFERLTSISLGILWFLRSPLWGGGIGSFYKSSVYAQMEVPPELAKYGWDYVHNTYIWFLAEGGLIGIFILLGLFWNFLRNAWRASQELPSPQNALPLAIFFALFAFYMMGWGIDMFQRRDMWLFFAFADLVRYLPKEEEIGVREGKRDCHAPFWARNDCWITPILRRARNDRLFRHCEASPLGDAVAI